MMTSENSRDLEAKLQRVKEEAARRFSRRGSSVTTTACNVSSSADPRLLDYMYESTFSATPPDAVTSPTTAPSLDITRDIVFALPDFKPAADRVAYSEDLLTRAVSLLEGMTRCRLCGSNNTTFTVRQMHSSDEAPTMMLYCGSCHHRTNQTGE